MTSSSPRDVRMRGFAERATVEAALAWVEAQVSVLGGETVDYRSAHGRVLAADVLAALDVPSFDRAAMDGYAVRAEETLGAGDSTPSPFRVIGEALPGRAFDGEVGPGETVRIMTGAPVPGGVDAVVPVESTAESAGGVVITRPISPGKHVGRRGEDVTAGSRLLAAGRRLRPQDVGLLASVGVSQVPVVRRPRVRVLITGNELVRPGQPLSPYQIYESNSAVLCGLVARDGGELESLQMVPDDREAIREALVAAGADVVLVSGGSSVGVEDHVPTILAAEGELAIHGVAMRPSSPTGMGRVGRALVFLLPGNPVSCLCAYDFFASRAIRRLGGRRGDWPYAMRTFRVSRQIVSTVGRVDYFRVAVDGEEVEPLALSGASILSSTTRADGFVIVPAECEGYAPGATIDVYLYDWRRL